MKSLTDVLEMAAQDTQEPLNIGVLVDAMQEQGFGWVLMLLALPSALPVPAAGYSTPFGLALFVLGWQRFRRHEVPCLPQRARAIRLAPKTAKRMIRFSTWVLSRTQRLIKPRGRIWWDAGAGPLLQGITLMVMAFLMILPIPLTNTGPAAVIFAMGLAMARRDGLLGGLALLAALGGLCVYAFILIFLRHLMFA